MQANQTKLVTLLDGKKQFIIPIYQRTYSWQIKQCQQLFDDILRVGGRASDCSHFIGSVVCFKPEDSTVTSFPQWLVIDGQQRLATVSLLLLAITHFLKEHDQSINPEGESWEEIRDTYLINLHRKDDTQFKLLLARKDKTTLIRLINGYEIEEEYSQRVMENYEFFKRKLSADNIQEIYHGIRKLMIIDVTLERGKDNPQLIFESLNSTGLDLSQADLIRNYMLMSELPEKQESLYEQYWFPMEQSFGEKIGSLAWFIRDYLTMKDESIPKINLVYETYKRYRFNKKLTIEQAIKNLYKYSKYYVRIELLKEPDPDIAKKLKEVTKLKLDTSYPFLLAVYSDYDEEKITKDEFIEIVDLVSNYIFRRAICGVPTNSLNKTFANLYNLIKKEAYLESVKATFLLMDGYTRFPTDAEFIAELKIKNIYKFRSKDYLLETLETWGSKEPVNTKKCTIEHILPQNPNVSKQWQDELGENWKDVKEKYLHTLGNLTLTGYNPTLSDKSFSEKKTIQGKTIQGGFNTSPLFLNKSVKEATTWNEAAILKRASILAEKACTVWSRPLIPDDILKLYKKSDEMQQSAYNLDHYDSLQGDMLDLYRNFEKRVRNLDSSVRVEFKNTHIAFKAQTNFVSVLPQKKRLKLYLNAEYDQIKDPVGICRDVSGVGKWGNGDVEVGLESPDGLDDVMELIEQTFEYQET